jgi:hypothetical protein
MVAGGKLWWRVGTSSGFKPVMCSYLIFQMTDYFGLFYISESKELWIFFSKLENCRFGLFQKHQRTSSFHEGTGKEPTVRKAFFF